MSVRRFKAALLLPVILLIGSPEPAVASFARIYTLAANGQRLSATDLNGRKSAYAYDALNRLTGETITGDPTGSNGSLTYTYDGGECRYRHYIGGNCDHHYQRRFLGSCWKLDQ